MKVFNEAAKAINPGGFRRGVNMAVLRIDRPGILEFINAKYCEGSLVNLNISAVSNDKSMTRNYKYLLVNPRNGAFIRTKVVCLKPSQYHATVRKHYNI